MSEEHIRGQILTWAQYQSYSVEVIHILTIITWIILQILFIYKFYFCCGRCMSGALRGQLGGHSRGGRRGPQSPAAPNLPSDRQLTKNRMLVISFNIWSFQPRCGQRRKWEIKSDKPLFSMMNGAQALMLVHWQEQGKYSAVHHHQLWIERNIYHSQQWPCWRGAGLWSWAK